MGSPTLSITEKRTSIEMRQGLSLAVTERPTVLEVTLGGQTLQLPIRRMSIEIREPLTLQVPIRRTTLEFTSPGVQGAPGPRQVYNGGSEPTAIPGYTLLWLKTPVPPTGDPNDRDVSLIE